MTWDRVRRQFCCTECKWWLESCRIPHFLAKRHEPRRHLHFH